METIILASGSPRRRDLLSRVHIPVKVISPNVPEDYDGSASASDLVAAIAQRKVEAVLELFKTESPRWVLGVDTVVVVGGKVLGKPSDAAEAEGMLRQLSGRVHEVYSGLALLVRRGVPLEQQTVRTEVKFREMAPSEIRFYLETGEWVGAAGGYRIQERGGFFVDWIRGSYSNVVGLPIEAFYGILVRSGFQF